jgi:regulator of protease activity HflC (stomatin/prohibitin superfamily)
MSEFLYVFMFCCAGVLLFVVIVAFAQSMRIVQQYEKGVVLRLGKFAGVAEPGVVFLIPFLDRIIITDVRERVINVAPQDVITKDNVTVRVDAVIYYRVIDPVSAVFEVEDFDLACTTLAQTNLRNVIGDLSLDESLTSRDNINVNLRDVLDEATNPWGVKVSRVEVQKIDPPVDITEAMSRQMKAERDKRASILESEGIKQSRILEAEGVKEADVLEAEGHALAEIRRAEAEAQAIKLVAEATEKYFHQRAELFKRMEITRDALKHNTKFVIPQGTDIINILSEDGAKIVPVPHHPKEGK